MEAKKIGEYNEKMSKVFVGPKSICICEHNGDGVNSQHAGYVGHGQCMVSGCDCTKFSWNRFAPKFDYLLLKPEGE
jgi:hypothetical protein